MKKIGLETARAIIVHTLEEALTAPDIFGYPCIIRPSFTMGGSGGGIAYNREEFIEICQRGLELSPTNELLIDESLLGWKEFEMEVVRDQKDNCIIICSIENLDPMGVHTGDSITVAPAQTLTDKEYQIMRNASIAVLREIGVETGGSNVQFAVNPVNGRMVVIEMNPRVSRSSALASKATGFPIAKIAAKLAVGFTLDELLNDITAGSTPASFEPSIDYVVTKIPRFAFEKFDQASSRLTTQMKSVGEVMAIGRNFQESFHKALRGLEVGSAGLEEKINFFSKDNLSELRYQLKVPGSERIWYVGDAFRAGMDITEVFNLTFIEPWFLYQIQELINEENIISKLSMRSLDKEKLYRLTQKGFSDKRLSQLLKVTEKSFRECRYASKVRPVYKRVDTCAAEFSTASAYMYSSYDEECEADPSNKDKILVLGGGPNRIGQGIEFDYCCVHAALAMREEGYETIMVNCNPETVSTDYDTSDRLYFEPVTLEDVLEIINIENPKGVIVQFGGQTPLKLAQALEDHGVPIIGTTPDAIDLAEDRERFQKMIEKLKLLQPPNAIVRSMEEAINAAARISYPLVVRPSYVLGGRAMEIVYGENELSQYMESAIKVSDGSPILLDYFLSSAIEVDIDAVSDGKRVVIGAIMQHIEQAGIHSGDSACCLPPISIKKNLITEIKIQTKKLALALNIKGFMNIQFAIKNDEIFVIEVNPRASRTVPFVSKAKGLPLAKIASRVMAGEKLSKFNLRSKTKNMFAVKEAVFPFNKFPKSDVLLGPEIKSTGEVMGFDKDFGMAFAKSQIGASNSLPTKGLAFISLKNSHKEEGVDLARQLLKLNFTLCGTGGTADFIIKHGMKCKKINKVSGGSPHIVDVLNSKKIALVINTGGGNSEQKLNDAMALRRATLVNKVPYCTNMSTAYVCLEGIKSLKTKKMTVTSLQDI